MKIKLTIKKIPSGRPEFPYYSCITHIKQVDEEGNFIKFIKHDEALIDQLNNIFFEIWE